MSDAIAVYPGSFDPLTNGHVDIIQRGSRFFDRIVIAVAINIDKAPLFTVPERVTIAREGCSSTMPGGSARPSSCAGCARYRISSTRCRWR
jgi:cytidyltransferase-like protein